MTSDSANYTVEAFVFPDVLSARSRLTRRSISMVASVEIIEHWRLPDPGASGCVLSGTSLTACYETANEQFALVVFPDWNAPKDGGPNDEAWHGPRSAGLFAYAVMSNRVNRVADRFDCEG